MFRLIILFIGLSFSQQIFADSLNLVINGKEVHENKRDFNEENWGLGFEYNFEEDKNWINFISGGFFEDSLSNTSKHLGGGTKRRFLLTDDKDGWHIDAGLTAFMMTRRDYKNNRPFFGALPFFSVGTSKVAINATYIPSVHPKYEALWFFQATFKMAKW